jgi:hypothetical protein
MRRHGEESKNVLLDRVVEFFCFEIFRPQSGRTFLDRILWFQLIHALLALSIVLRDVVRFIASTCIFPRTFIPRQTCTHSRGKVDANPETIPSNFWIVEKFR